MPNMVNNASCHGSRHAERALNQAEIIPMGIDGIALAHTEGRNDFRNCLGPDFGLFRVRRRVHKYHFDRAWICLLILGGVFHSLEARVEIGAAAFAMSFLIEMFCFGSRIIRSM